MEVMKDSVDSTEVGMVLECSLNQKRVSFLVSVVTLIAILNFDFL